MIEFTSGEFVWKCRKKWKLMEVAGVILNTWRHYRVEFNLQQDLQLAHHIRSETNGFESDSIFCVISFHSWRQTPAGKLKIKFKEFSNQPFPYTFCSSNTKRAQRSVNIILISPFYI